jgi:hypothetical protein
MSIFSAILDKLGFGKKAEAATLQAPAAATPHVITSPSVITTPDVITQPDVAAPQIPTAISEVDVVAKLEGMAAANPQTLNWKLSIVDLLKLLSLDSSLESRKTLAVELACPEAKMADSAEMNMWLHKAVLQRLAENGGNIPKELL